MREHQRAALYRSLARLLDAGLGIESAYATLARAHADAGPALASLESAQRGGLPLSDALAAVPGAVFPRHEVALVRAAEQTASVPDALHQLADDLERRRRSRRAPVAHTVYALALMHGAVIAPNAGLLYSEPLTGVLHVLAVLLPIDAIIALGWYGLARPNESRVLGQLALLIPGLRGTAIHGGYRAWFAGLHRLHSAGVPLSSAGPEALGAVGNPVFRRRLRIAITGLSYDKPLGDVLARLPALSGDLNVVLTTAESSGTLEEALLHASARSSEAEEQSCVRLGRLLAAASFSVAAAYIAVRLILFYVHHFGRIVPAG